MNNQVQFVCFWHNVPPDFAFQIKNVFSLVLFSAVIHKRRGKKLISKTIKYKLGSSSKMQFAFFCNMKTFKFFLENYQFCQKSGNDANSRGREEGGGAVEWGHVRCVIMTQCIRKSICDLPLKYHVVKYFDLKTIEE